MSHFAVLVVGENPEEQLAKYDENLEREMHLVKTREQLVSDKRAWMERYKNGVYAEYLADPEKYKAKCDNESHIDYLKNVFPKELEWTDNEVYEAEVSDYRESIADGADWVEIHEDGSVWKNTNSENAKWDYYVLGGRYRGHLKLHHPNQDAPLYTGWQYSGKKEKEEYARLKREGYCDQARKRDIANWLDNDFLCFACVIDGEWHERGEMGWWACVSNDKGRDSWEEEFRALLADVRDSELISVYDCHI